MGTVNTELLHSLRPDLFDTHGYATVLTRQILGLGYQLGDRVYTLREVVEMTQPWVAATKKNDQGQPAQRWEVIPPEAIAKLAPEVYLPLFKEARFFDPMAQPMTGYSVDDLVIPGGRLRPQWLRLTQLATEWAQGLKFRNLLFQVGGRLLGDDELDLQHVRDLQALGSSLRGGWSLRPGVEIPDFRKGDTELHLMALLWRILDLPEELAKVVPSYSSPAAWFDGREARVVRVISIQPHRFHELMFERLVPPGSQLSVVFVGAEYAEHRPAYLMDGFGRYQKELLKKVTS